MIQIFKSPNADSRSAKTTPTVDQLRKSTYSHMDDVSKGMQFIANTLHIRGMEHDHTKIEMMEEFHSALTSGKIKESDWYQKHITEERHHLKSNVPEDVNLIDVIEHIVDCVMAGLARSGEIYDVDISPDVLRLAAQNTVDLIKNNTEVVEPEKDILDENIPSELMENFLKSSRS